MRIGVFDPYLDDIGGGEKYMMTLASCLSKENKVDVFWDKREDFSLIQDRFHLDLSHVTLVPNLFTNHTSLLKRFIHTKQYDVIIVLSDGSVPLVGSRKLFLHVQQPLSVFQHASVFEKLKLKRITKIFCNSQYTKSFIDQKFHFKSDIIYPPVILHPKKVKRENIVLHVGRFRVRNVQNGDYKKQSTMIQAFKDMVDHGLKGWEFVLAVSIQPQDTEAFARVQESVNGYPIRFLVNQTNEKLWDIYSKAKIYWHASGYGEDLDKHPEFAEHFGISTVEAMGAGCVPIVINAGGQKEIVHNEENGFLWNTIEELKARTKEVMKDNALWEKLSKAAQTDAKQYEGNAFCQKVHDLVS